MKPISKSIVVSLCVLSFTGCAGNLYTVINPTLSGTDKKVDGIITYQPVNVIELYKTTVYVDEKTGNATGSLSDGGCIEVKKTKFSTRADYNKPQLVGYAPGILDKNKFTLTLKDGVIASVNSESDPTSALNDIATILPFVKAPYAETKSALMQSVGKPLCNAGEKLIGLYMAPGVLPFEDMPK